jgi:hypothetical protein
MTQARKLKKIIRSRARKTGESYAAARRSYLKPPPAPPAPTTKSRPRVAGSVSDAASIKNTGHGLDHWFAALDEYTKGKKGHTDAARHLYEDLGVPMWYCQGITVAWERARGHRVLNQSCDGDFQVSVSRVVPVELPELIRLVGEAKERARWLRDADPTLVRALTAAFTGEKAKGLRTANPKRARLRYRWEPGVVEILLEPRPGGKSSIVAANTELPDLAAVERRRALWQEALDGLRKYVMR